MSHYIDAMHSRQLTVLPNAIIVLLPMTLEVVLAVTNLPNSTVRPSVL